MAAAPASKQHVQERPPDSTVSPHNDWVRSRSRFYAALAAVWGALAAVNLLGDDVIFALGFFILSAACLAVALRARSTRS